MKKLIFLLLIVSSIFISCGERKNVNGWYEDFEAAQKEAVRKNKNILLFVTSFRDEEKSSGVVSALLDSSDFVKGVSDRYSCVFFDFSDEAEMRSLFDENATNKEQKMAEKRQKVLAKQRRFADLYSVRETPVVMLISKEGYFISEVTVDFSGTSVQGYIANVALEDENVKNFEGAVLKTKKGLNLDKVRAIDELYDSVSEEYRMSLAPLCRKVLVLDKNDESGLLDKYIEANCYIDVQEKLLQNDFAGAVEVCEKNAKNKRVSPVTSQTFYFLAAQIGINLGILDLDRILYFIECSIDAAPDTDVVPQLEEMHEAIEKIMNSSN